MICSEHVFTDIVLGCLPYHEIQRYQQICKACVDPVQHFITAHYQLEPFLSPFFCPNEALEFRHCLRDFEMFVSGSFPVQLLRRERFANADLDVYCHFENTIFFVPWLLKLGYAYQPPLTSNNLPPSTWSQRLLAICRAPCRHCYGARVQSDHRWRCSLISSQIQ